MKVCWLTSALCELDRIYEYVSRDNPKAAKAVFRRIRATTMRLARFPDIGKRGHVEGTREVIVNGLPYVVVYRIGSGSVEIIRVLHMSMDRSPIN